MADERTCGRISDLPQDFRDAIACRILNHSVGIIRIHKNRSCEDVQLIGSGTLVQADGIHGILTAHHVLEVIPSTGQLGLILPMQGTKHRYLLDIAHLIKVPIARGSVDSEGPDLGFVRLPDEYRDQIAAWSTAWFYDLSATRYAKGKEPFDTGVGMWAVCGFPDEFTKEQESDGYPDSTKEYQANCLLGNIRREYSSGNYDYLDLTASYENDLPSSFGGVSGGGLWHIVLEQPPRGSVRVKHEILSGVAFYQSTLKDKHRVIRCHGRTSVYQMAYECIMGYSNSRQAREGGKRKGSRRGRPSG